MEPPERHRGLAPLHSPFFIRLLVEEASGATNFGGLLRYASQGRAELGPSGCHHNPTTPFFLSLSEGHHTGVAHGWTAGVLSPWNSSPRAEVGRARFFVPYAEPARWRG